MAGIGDWFDGDDEAGAAGGFSDWYGGDQPSVRTGGSLSTFTPLEGAAMSTLSAIPELFGMDPLSGVEDWRQQHPVMDIATQLAGIAIPYAGMAKLSQVPRAAKALEAVTTGTLRAFGASEATAPIAAGALKEFYRFTPLELSRLGTGFATGNEDMGGLFADVALSQAIAGVFGGVGGFLRAGGRAVAGETKLAEAPAGLLPNFELRIGLQPESNIVGPMSREQFLFEKQLEALRYVPEQGPKGLQGRYLYDVENMAPTDVQWAEGNLFKANPSRLSDEALQQRAFDVRQLHSDGKAWSVGDGMGEDLAKRAGFESLTDLAANVAYPRRVVVNDIRSGAAQMGSWMKRNLDSGAMQQIADDTFIMREDGGLFTVLKRLTRGAEPPKHEGAKRGSFQFGPAKVRQGDEWLVGKMDNLEKVAPEAHKIAKVNVEQWAKMRDAFRQLPSANPWNLQMNRVMQLLDPSDWQTLRTVRRSSGVPALAGKIGARLKEMTGLADQETAHRLAEGFYDVVAPKAFKMQKDPTYGRYMMLLEDLMRTADDQTKRILYGDPQTTGRLTKALANDKGAIEFGPHDGFASLRSQLERLTDEELLQFNLITLAPEPSFGAELQKLADDGVISPKVKEVVEHFQAVNKHTIEKWAQPALEEAGRAGEIAWLEGYAVPRVYAGDAFVHVTDEAGKLKFVASGATPKAAQQMADVAIAEAAQEGKIWKASKVRSRALESGKPGEALDEAFRMVQEEIAIDNDAQAIVAKAVRRMLVENAPSVRRGVPTPRSLTMARTGVRGTPDVMPPGREDTLKAVENHYKMLLRYSAMHSWKHRFGDQMLRWGKRGRNEVMYNDLMRKASQWMGVEGQLTTTINKLVNPVLGDVLGAKSATRIANATNKLMANWNLFILNPTFALLNLMTPLQTVAPWIAMMQKAPEAEVARISQQMLVRNAEGLPTGVAGVVSPLKVMWEATGLIRNPTDELKGFFSQAVSDGTLAPQIYDEFVGAKSGMVSGLRDAWAKSGWEFIKETATHMSTRSEQWSRLVAFNSAYVLGRDLFKLSDDALYRFMRKGTETTMYGYSVMDRSRILTGPVGGTWGLFKNWQFHFIGQMAQYAGLGIKDGIWAPMVWQGASALALGGLGATPLVVFADGLAKWHSESPDSFTWLQNNWGGKVADGVYFGLPALLGVSLQASSSIPGTDVMQDIEAMSSVVAWQRGKQAFSSVGDAFNLWNETGNNPLRNPNIRDRLMSAFAPRAMFRAYSAMEGDYIRSMSTGMPTVRDLPLGARVLHGAGINLTEIEKHYIVGERFYETQQRKRETITALGDEMAQAWMARDFQAMGLLEQRALASGVDLSSVVSSANTRYRREMFGDHLSRFDRRDQAEARAMLEQ